MSFDILHTLKVLYVEDEVVTRKIILKALKERLGKVIVAVDAADGIKKFKEFKPDVIITDLVLPDMNGIEMINIIRKDGSRCPVVITSSRDDSETILRSIDVKIDKYIVKPINIDMLMKTIQSIGVNIAEQHHDIFIKNGQFVLSKEQKNSLELEIRNIYSKYLKSITGKGARSIQVFLKGKKIEILLKDNLTLIEENLIKAGKHYKGVEVIRKTIYEDTKKIIEKELSNLIENNIELNHVEIRHDLGYELIIFSIKE